MLDPDRYPAVSRALQRQLVRMAVSGPTVSPELYPADEDRLAYWYNARTAWSIALAMRLHEEKKTDPSLLENFLFPLDGRQRTLADIDRAVFALGGYRAVVAAPGANLRRAALPERPFAAATIRRDIRRRFSSFVDDEKRFVIDVSNRRILVPPILWRYRETLLSRHIRRYGAAGATFPAALLPQVDGSAERRLQDAVGYLCVESTVPDAMAWKE